MLHATNSWRFQRLVLVVLTGVGAYYAALGTLTLVTLPRVTSRWIELSGDSDFRHDYWLFLQMIGFGGLAAGLLGAFTVTEAVRTLRSRGPAAWAFLAVAVTLLHIPWFFYRVIATAGTSDPESAKAALLMFTARCGVITLLYFLAWLLSRRGSMTRMTAGGAFT